MDNDYVELLKEMMKRFEETSNKMIKIETSSDNIIEILKKNQNSLNEKVEKIEYKLESIGKELHSEMERRDNLVKSVLNERLEKLEKKNDVLEEKVTKLYTTATVMGAIATTLVVFGNHLIKFITNIFGG